MRDPLDWITGDDTGISSQAIWKHMMQGRASDNHGFGTYPHDPDDFGRCYRLLKLFPAWRARIGEMARYSKEWAALAGAWDELTVLYEAEVDTSRPRHSGNAHKLYDRMQGLLRPIEDARGNIVRFGGTHA